MTGRRPRLLVHVQHLVGTGHLRRMMALSDAAATAGFEVRLLSGGPPLPGMAPALAPAVTPVVTSDGASSYGFVQLPPTRSADLGYSGLVDAAGAPVDDSWKAARRKLAIDQFRVFAPQVLVVETWPFGRRLIEFELLALMDAAAAAGCARICSVRDVVEPRTRPQRIAEMAARAAALDAILVHGDARVMPFEVGFGRGAADLDPFRDKLHYTGYLTATPRASGDAIRDDRVLVSLGGGALGAALREATLAAAALDGQRPWELFTGRNLPEAEFQAVRRAAPSNLRVARHTQQLLSKMRRCGVSVSQAGYNTAVELLVTRCPALLVPYELHGEVEQVLRAETFASCGLAHVLRQSRLAERRALLDAVTRARDAGPPAALAVSAVGVDGLAETARALATFVAR